MRAMQIIEWGKPLEPREYPTPTPIGEQVLVRVESAGVCHSDVHIWDGYFDLGGGNKVTLEQRGVKLPFTMGHEIAGEVVALGPEARGVEVGKRYAVYPWIGCGTCGVCKRGEELLCLTPRTLGTRTSGGYGSHVLVPKAGYLVDYGALPQPLAATYTCSGITAFSALKKLRGHVDAGDPFLIIGAGGVGGQAVHIAPSYIGNRMMVADVDRDKRARATEMGAAATIDNGAADALQQVLDQSGGGVAGAVDFVGSPKTMEFGNQRAPQGRQAGDGGALRRLRLGLHRPVPVQDDDDRGLVRRHPPGPPGAVRSRAGRQGRADPDRATRRRPRHRIARRPQGGRQGPRPRRDDALAGTMHERAHGRRAGGIGAAPGGRAEWAPRVRCAARRAANPASGCRSPVARGCPDDRTRPPRVWSAHA